MVKHDCILYFGKCQGLKELYCRKDEECRFYKNKEMEEEIQRKIKERKKNE